MLLSLSESDRSLLRQLQRTESAKHDYVKITTLLMLDRGKSPDEVADTLGIDHTTVYHYAQRFGQVGLKSYLGQGYQGWWGKLDSRQLAALHHQVQQQFYTSSAAIATWIGTTCGVEYHAQGLVRLLHRLGFAYKKTTLVAPKADAERQAAFLAQMQPLLQALPAEEVLYFADAVHPQHNTRPSYGWTLVGQPRPVACDSSRFRLNINAVVNAHDPVEVIARQDERIDSTSTIALLEAVLAANPTKTRIHVVCDSATYYVSKQVAQWLADKPITLHPLPPYSPNLNLIERLWKYLRRVVIDSIYYPTLADFRGAVMGFLDNLQAHRLPLQRLMTLRFALVNPSV